jgi:hypothetical protein
VAAARAVVERCAQDPAGPLPREPLTTADLPLLPPRRVMSALNGQSNGVGSALGDPRSEPPTSGQTPRSRNPARLPHVLVYANLAIRLS